MDGAVERRVTARDARLTPALQGARRLTMAGDDGAGCANGVAPNWSARVRCAAVDRRSFRPSAPAAADLRDDLQIREAAEPGQRHGVTASPSAGGTIPDEHVDVGVMTVVNKLDEIGLSTELTSEIGMAFEKHLQGRWPGALIIRLLSFSPRLGAREYNHANELRLFIQRE